MSKSTETGAGCVTALALWPLSTLLNAWVLLTLWAWFVVPTFHALPLTVPQAAGLGLLASWLRMEAPKGEAKDSRPLAEILLTGVLCQGLAAALTLAGGWIVKGCM